MTDRKTTTMEFRSYAGALAAMRAEAKREGGQFAGLDKNYTLNLPLRETAVGEMDACVKVLFRGQRIVYIVHRDLICE